MAGSEALTLWQIGGSQLFSSAFHCPPHPPFSFLLLDAATAVGALQSTTGDRELGCAEK